MPPGLCSELELSSSGAKAKSEQVSESVTSTAPKDSRSCFNSGYAPAVARRVLENTGFEIELWELYHPSSRGHIAVIAISTKEETAMKLKVFATLAILLLLSLTVWSYGQTRSSSRTRWEYKTVGGKDLRGDLTLNEMGMQGWELAAVTIDGSQVYYFTFKRPFPNHP